MTFRLKGFRSLWGAPSATRLGVPATSASSLTREAHADALLARISAQGFDGIEASVSDLANLNEDAGAVTEMLQRHSLQLIVGVYSGWTDYEPCHEMQQFDGVSNHLARYREQLERVAAFAPALVWVNAHSGSDHWRKLEQLEFMAHALEIERELGLHDTLSHETHRGRMLGSPWPTLELLRAFPALKLTLDFSHWCVTSERLLDTPWDHEWLARVIPHVAHVHGRIGSPQHAQLQHAALTTTRTTDKATPAAQPGHGEESAAIPRFEALWDSLWNHQWTRFQQVQEKHERMNQMTPNQKKTADLNDGGAPAVDAWVARGFATFTPEYGPAPYAPVEMTTGKETYDVDALCAQQMQHQRLRFERLVAQRTEERSLQQRQEQERLQLQQREEEEREQAESEATRLEHEQREREAAEARTSKAIDWAAGSR